MWDIKRLLQELVQLLNLLYQGKMITHILFICYKKIILICIFISMSLKTELSYEEYAWLISEIRSKIEGNDNDSPAHKYLIFKFSSLTISLYVS